MNADTFPVVADSGESLTSGYATGLVIGGLLAGLAVLGLVMSALAQIMGIKGLSVLSKSVWAVAVIGLPLIGSLLWFLLGRDSVRSTQVYG
ncbi:PLDc N-terminal domain-containing protein [Gordonia humi]|uniref:Drug/metabolite transporter (DMT)-like permease n=1 Tax=Gordonia humi TaxID=686429 RepID=A0A840EZY6_9ACTN|nr:PLDc N-terminal domain-containing protein [Gordonia humi]MBB4135326.1 drug/metabolite transporter (DMT)-like permease [Gordonia humi]